MNWIRSITIRQWIIFLFFISLWISAILIRMRFKQIEKKGEIRYGSVKSIFSNTNNYISLGKFEYSDVIWNVQVPAPDLPYSKEYYLSKISPSSISVKRRPRCPKCETELEEEHSFWGGYVWKCVYCKFKKRKKNSFYEEVDRVDRIVRRTWEKKLEKR